MRAHLGGAFYASGDMFFSVLKIARRSGDSMLRICAERTETMFLLINKGMRRRCRCDKAGTAVGSVLLINCVI